MAVLVPHLSRALGLMFRLRDAELKVAASLAALDRLARGVFLLGERGHAIFANHVAQRLIDERDGLWLRTAQFNRGLRSIVAADAATNARIEAAIADCLDEHALTVAHFSRAIAVRRPSGRPDLALQLAPLPRENEYDADGRRARVIVFLTDPREGTDVDASTLAKLYGLTRAESRLALRLGRGETLTNAAKASGITIATARTHLAAVFQKTDTTRQAALVRLLVALGSTRGDST
jgi:DNA-binding CsgD family transcriptional regulator